MSLPGENFTVPVLILRCIENDAEAWVELWEVYDRVCAISVRRLLRLCGFNAADADDVAQEIFLRFYANDMLKLRAFLGNERDFEGWLLTVATNFTFNWIDQQRRFRRRAQRAQGRPRRVLDVV
jgi:DNA-directed RNA polymerase specialized sigma24 family protein